MSLCHAWRSTHSEQGIGVRCGVVNYIKRPAHPQRNHPVVHGDGGESVKKRLNWGSTAFDVCCLHCRVKQQTLVRNKMPTSDSWSFSRDWCCMSCTVLLRDSCCVVIIRLDRRRYGMRGSDQGWSERKRPANSQSPTVRVVDDEWIQPVAACKTNIYSCRSDQYCRVNWRHVF